MNTTTIIIAIVLVLIAVGALFYFRRRRSETLRKQASIVPVAPLIIRDSCFVTFS